MRFRLSTLLVWLTLAPAAIALMYWSIQFALGGPMRGQVYLMFVAVSLYSCVALLRGISSMLFGPSAAESWRQWKRRKRKQRRKVRVRIGRYAAGST